jgi:crotonobetainyl-CoA:carnitine CoA-transferase CaiB-like acyl-CoA transferase
LTRPPLEDVRVIAVEQYGAGPFGSLHLADLGADVIKIENPRDGGDVGRAVPPYAEGGDSLFFQTFNRGKRSLALDLTTVSGQEVLRDLVTHSDAVYSNLRGDLPARLRITYDDLAPANRRIVCVSLSGYGIDGPRASEPAYDYILQGLAGWMDVTGDPDGPPTKTGLSLVDYLGGIAAAFSLLAGVHAARRDGVGGDCDVSLYDVAMSMLTYPATWWLNEGYRVTRRRNSAHPSLVPFQNFETSNGWIVVGCAKEKFWRRLCVALDRSDLADDPRFSDFAARRANADALLPQLEARFREEPSATWLQRLAAAGVPSGPVNTLPQALADEMIAVRDVLVAVDHPSRGPMRLPATGVRVTEHRPTAAAAPPLNADADSVLGDLLGYDEQRRAALHRAGAFG